LQTADRRSSYGRRFASAFRDGRTPYSLQWVGAIWFGAFGNRCYLRLQMKDFAEAGVHFKAFLATWHAWLNNKLGGDRELIRKAADLFRHSWLSLGVPGDKVEFIYSDELYKDIDYWAKTVIIAKNLTIARTTRTLEIAGRQETEAHYVSDYLYTPMQIADIFHMKVKICQLGMDQRKANMVAREIGEKIGCWKPTCVHHHLLQGLEKPTIWPIPEGQEKKLWLQLRCLRASLKHAYSFMTRRRK